MKVPWEIRTRIRVPVRVSHLDPDGNLRGKLTFESYIRDGSSDTLSSGVQLRFSKWPVAAEAQPTLVSGSHFEPWLLTATVEANDGNDALEQASADVEWLCDRLSFALQRPVSIQTQDVRRVDGVGNVSHFPDGYQPVKFRAVSHLADRYVDVTLSIPDRAGFPVRDRTALRWFHKALAAAYEVDKFIFFWICLEIVCKADGVALKKPYRAPCTHQICYCPQCGRSTEKEVSGATLQNFLVTQLGVSQDDAKELWGLRQILHGATDLTDESTSDMSKLTMILHAAITLGLKRRLGLGDNSPPSVSPEGVAMHSPALNHTQHQQPTT